MNLLQTQRFLLLQKHDKELVYAAALFLHWPNETETELILSEIKTDS